MWGPKVKGQAEMRSVLGFGRLDVGWLWRLLILLIDFHMQSVICCHFAVVLYLTVTWHTCLCCPVESPWNGHTTQGRKPDILFIIIVKEPTGCRLA